MDRIPAELEGKMKLWRAGLTAMPKEYIDFHHKAALASVEKDFGKFTVHRVYSAPDGWCDGMVFVHVIIEDSKGVLSKIKWSDSGHWYSQCASGGWGIFYPAK